MMIYSHLLFALAVVATMSLLSVALAAQEDVALKVCATGDFEESYFNFFIEIEEFTEDEMGMNTCPEFDSIGELAQAVISEIQECIPEYEDEFINAEICPDPEFVSQRRLRSLGAKKKRKRGKYGFAGTGGCKRCRRNSAVRRVLASEKQADHQSDAYRSLHLADLNERELGKDKKKDEKKDDEKKKKEEEKEEVVVVYQTVEEYVCGMLDSVAADVAVAERAVVAANNKLQELLAVSKEPETTENLEDKDIDKFIKEGEKKLKECEEDRLWAKSRAFYVVTACENAKALSLETEQDEQGYEMVAGDLVKGTGNDAKHAQDGFYKVKGQKIGLKTAVVKKKFDKLNDAMKKELEIIREKVDVEVDELKQQTKLVEADLKVKGIPGEKKAELNSMKNELKGKQDELKDEFEQLKRIKEQKWEKDYEFAMGTLEVEAANSFEDYMEAFADLIAPALEERLKSLSADCFVGLPKVHVSVDKLNSQKDQLQSCPTSG